MRVVRDIHACPPACKGTVLALGNFDGIHRGHDAILRHCLDFAKTEGRPAAAMTFEPHPREFFSKTREPLRIYSLKTKIHLLEQAGLDVLFLVRFNARFASTSAASFIEDILHREMNVRHVVTGYNFAFGKGRGGDTAMLTDEARRLGFGFTALPPVEDEGTVISSSAIRDALKAGDMEKAAHMLGRPYTISGRVRKGDQRGRTLGFPTANLRLGKLFHPRFGVYAVRVSFDGRNWHPGVANLGIRPTFSASEPLLEVHCFDMEKDMYGAPLHVELSHFIRDEKKFNDVTALVTQIKTDSEQARRILKRKIA